jgi:hypothetical protein
VAVVLTLARRSGKGLARVIWLVVPTAVVAAPLVWHRLREGDAWALLADPGVATASDLPASDLLGRLLLTAGFPTTDVAGWAGFAGEAMPAWIALLIAPLALLAVLAPVTARLLPAAVLLLTAVLGATTAIVASGVALSASGSTVVALWPGGALSLAWAGIAGAAALTLDRLDPVRGARGLSAVVVVLSLAVVAVPALTSLHRDALTVTNGPDSTLPAYVDAEGKGDPHIATLVMRPQPHGGIATEIVWGGSATLGGQTTLQSARSAATSADVATAEATADLVTGSASDVVAVLAGHGIGYVLLEAPGESESDAARAVRLVAKAALDRRDDLEAVGDTGKGELWFVSGDVDSRAATSAQQAQAWRNAALQLGVVVVSLLLAVPTASSLRRARRAPRVVGGAR